MTLGAFLRHREVRAVLYQAAILGLVALGAWWIFSNTLANLEQRGISSGFGFLGNEAGFGISETPPVPRLRAGMIHFLVACGIGLAAVWGMARWERAQGRALGGSTPKVVLAAALLVGLPGIVLWSTGHTIETVNYNETASYGLALVTGLINTLKVATMGCVLATVLGLVIGMARLSSNWLVSKLAETYIEVLRNIPLLVQLFFWYKAVLASLPGPRQSVDLWGLLILNNRGVYLPAPLPQSSAGTFGAAVVAALVGAWFWARHVRQRQERTGERLPVLYPTLGLLVALPGLVWLAGGTPFGLEFPELAGFNFRGGLVLSPEYAALLAGLVLYTASFIAEIVRSGIQAVDKGQREAALAIGLRRGLVMRLVILPQALRVIVPPLTSQYLNLTKNSSLAVAIGYPDLVSVGGTTLNQSGQAIEVIGITMLVYLTFSLGISVGMNWYNARVRLVER
jgi:general L-amino acid transport system permease protein